LERSSELVDFRLVKEKSWSVRITESQLQEGKVRTMHFSQCKRSCDLVVIGRGNSNSIFYGCAESKCTHILMNVKSSSVYPQYSLI
jgi:hypothetical protein